MRALPVALAVSSLLLLSLARPAASEAEKETPDSAADGGVAANLLAPSPESVPLDLDQDCTDRRLQRAGTTVDGGADVADGAGLDLIESLDANPEVNQPADSTAQTAIGQPVPQTTEVAPTPTPAPPMTAESVANARPRAPRLPVFGLGADVGVPDGANLSLVIRPLSWTRAQLGIGSNGVSCGFRVGLSLLPFRQGPGLVTEYGHYLDGNANALASKFGGSDFRQSPVLERVGYDYFNLHLGLNLGHKRLTFFVQGGLSLVRGHLNSSEPIAYGTASGSGTIKVAVLEKPQFKSTGIAGKLGLIVYIW